MILDRTLVVQMGGTLFTADYAKFAELMVDENIVKNIKDLRDATVDDRNVASPYIHIDVLYDQNFCTFGICGSYNVMQDFYHQQ